MQLPIDLDLVQCRFISMSSLYSILYVVSAEILNNRYRNERDIKVREGRRVRIDKKEAGSLYRSLSRERV